MAAFFSNKETHINYMKSLTHKIQITESHSILACFQFRDFFYFVISGEFLNSSKRQSTISFWDFIFNSLEILEFTSKQIHGY